MRQFTTRRNRNGLPHSRIRERHNGQVVGVRLGDVAANSSLDIEVRYELPNGLLFLPGREPALRVEVFRSPTDSDGKK